MAVGHTPRIVAGEAAGIVAEAAADTDPGAEGAEGNPVHNSVFLSSMSEAVGAPGVAASVPAAAHSILLHPDFQAAVENPTAAADVGAAMRAEEAEEAGETVPIALEARG